MPIEMKLPDIGEGVHEAEVIKWLVSPGQRVNADDLVIEVNTDKAIVEIPARRAGTVVSLAVRPGDIVKVGAALFTLRTESESTHSEPYDLELQPRDPAPRSTAPSSEPIHTIADVGHAGPPKRVRVHAERTIADTGGSLGSLHILTTIGEGGMARVMLARDTSRNKFVAVKRLHRRLIDDPKAVARFQSEADAMRQLRHNHIVAAFDSGTDADGPFIVMEYVEGPARVGNTYPRGWQDDWPNPSLSLDELVKEQGKLTPKQTVTLGAKLCLALEHAHGRPVPLYHRDIKPLNVLFFRSIDHPKLVDFGLVKQRDAREYASTMIGGRMGSEGYMAPEQETDASSADHCSDIYSLARTLWFAATGDRPQDFAHSRMDESLRTVLLKASDPTRETRYQSPAEFRSALEESLTKAAAAPAPAQPASAASVPITKPAIIAPKPTITAKPWIKPTVTPAVKPKPTSKSDEFWGCVGLLFFIYVIYRVLSYIFHWK